MRRSVFILLVAFCWLADDALGVSESALAWDLEANLQYIDKAERPAFTLIQTEEGELPAGESHRALGLSRFRVGLLFGSGEAASLAVNLRPDAGIREKSGGTEFDSRAGEVYRSAPSLDLLNAYSLRLSAGESLFGEVGVFEELATQASSYNPILAFGLQVRFPSRFSGAILGWRYKPDNASEERRSGLEIDLVGLQGNEDVVDRDSYREGTFDRAPSASDPYLGMALRARFRPVIGIEFGVVAANTDNAVTQGRRNEVDVQISSQVWSETLRQKPKVALDFRYSKEKWRLTTVEIAPRVQQSIAVTSSAFVARDLALYLGFHFGRSDRAFSAAEPDRIRPFEGHQLDFGIEHSVTQDLVLGLAVAEEQRTRENDAGDTEGGFLNAGSSRRTIRRMGALVSYRINE